MNGGWCAGRCFFLFVAETFLFLIWRGLCKLYFVLKWMKIWGMLDDLNHIPRIETVFFLESLL